MFSHENTPRLSESTFFKTEIHYSKCLTKPEQIWITLFVFKFNNTVFRIGVRYFNPHKTQKTFLVAWHHEPCLGHVHARSSRIFSPWL